MIYLIKTGSYIHDSYYLSNHVLPGVEKHYSRIVRIPAEQANAFELLKLESDTISFFETEKKAFILFDTKIAQEEKKLLSMTNNSSLVILVNPNTRSLSLGEKTFLKPLAPYEIRKLVISELSSAQLPSDEKTINNCLQQLQYIDERGSLSFNPLLIKSTVKQMKLLGGKVLENSHHSRDPWQLLPMLFKDKEQRDTYFSGLLESTDIFEILSTLRSQLGLLIAIQIGKEEHVDDVSLSKQLNKNPYYISNLVQLLNTIRKESVFLQKLFQRLLFLEYRIKSGEIDEPEMAFMILLATI